LDLEKWLALVGMVLVLVRIPLCFVALAMALRLARILILSRVRSS